MGIPESSVLLGGGGGDVVYGRYDFDRRAVNRVSIKVEHSRDV